MEPGNQGLGELLHTVSQRSKKRMRGIIGVAHFSARGEHAAPADVTSEMFCALVQHGDVGAAPVRRLGEGEQVRGGIIVPDTAKEKPQEGEVVAVGPGIRDEDGKLHPLDVKQGDRVLFGKWSGTEVKLDGVDLMIMKEADIMGVLDRAVPTKKAA